MSFYDDYKDLLGQAYVEGDHDCYGLFRRYYKKNYGMDLSNYARPIDFATSGLDLIMELFADEGFQIVEVSLHNLEVGDGLLMQINGSPLVNHVAVYAGNQMIVHHLYNSLSKEDSYSERWKSRTVTVVRHPDVMAHNWKRLEIVKFQDVDYPPVPGAE